MTDLDKLDRIRSLLDELATLMRQVHPEVAERFSSPLDLRQLRLHRLLIARWLRWAVPKDRRSMGEWWAGARHRS